MVAEGSSESREALTDAADVVARPTTVHAEGARLGAAMAIEPRGADWGQRGDGSQEPKRLQPAWPPVQSHIMMKGGFPKIWQELPPPHTLEGPSLSAESCGPFSTEKLVWALNLGVEKPGQGERGLEGGI